MKILLVEDEKKFAQLLERRLKAENFAVEVVHDGVSATEAVAAKAFDFVILDILLPVLRGFGLEGMQTVMELEIAQIEAPEASAGPAVAGIYAAR